MHSHSAAFVPHALDTRAEAERVRVEAIRARSPEARLQDAAELSELVHGAAMRRLRVKYPTYSTLELALELYGLTEEDSVTRGP